MFTNLFDLLRFTILCIFPMALTLASGHKVSLKQSLFGRFSYTLVK